MKKVLMLAAVASFLNLLGGCAVYTPGGAVIVDPNRGGSGGHRGGGDFCPPGQAKKGNC